LKKQKEKPKGQIPMKANLILFRGNSNELDGVIIGLNKFAPILFAFG